MNRIATPSLEVIELPGGHNFAIVEGETNIHIANVGDSPLSKERGYLSGNTIQKTANALVAAYNGTYGVGIRPEAVADLKKCLEELLAQFEKVVEPKYTLDHMLIREAKVAIEKAKL